MMEHLVEDQRTEQELIQAQERSRLNLVVRNHLRSVENSLEHLPLFVVGNFYLVWNTESGQNASDILLGDEQLFIAASVAISALSAFRGQESIFFSDIMKNTNGM